MSMPFLPHTFDRGGYKVTVDRDRSIKVKEGDWLSKYSMAIYGDFDHIDKFKIVVDGNYARVPNPDLITTGDILYHPDPLPREPARFPAGFPVPGPPLQAKYVREFLRTVKQRYNVSPWRVEMESGRGDPHISTTHRLRFTKPGSSVLFKTQLYDTLGTWVEHCDGLYSTRMHEYGTILTVGDAQLTREERRSRFLLLDFGRNLCYAGRGPVSLVLFSWNFEPVDLLYEMVKYFRFGHRSSPGFGGKLFAAIGVMVLAPTPVHPLGDDGFTADTGYMYVERR